VKFLDFGVEVFKGRAQTPGQVVALGQKGVPLGPEDAQIEFAVEERDFEAPSLEVPLDDEPKKAREPLVVAQSRDWPARGQLPRGSRGRRPESWEGGSRLF